MRQRVAEMGLGQWFHPSVTVVRRGDLDARPAPANRVIQHGDLLHCDFGIVYLGFATDTQENAYVLMPNETDAPAGLKEGLKAANRLQEITMQAAKVGTSGNAALSAALDEARKEGIVPAIFCHPIGYHGHGAGPPIGMIDYQSGIPGRGDWLFHPNTWYAIELNVLRKVKEWGDEPVRFGLEEDAALLEGGWDWIDGRQTRLYLIQ
jgi:Xaa-Pro aminopeptidase